MNKGETHTSENGLRTAMVIPRGSGYRVSCFDSYFESYLEKFFDEKDEAESWATNYINYVDHKQYA